MRGEEANEMKKIEKNEKKQKNYKKIKKDIISDAFLNRVILIFALNLFSLSLFCNRIGNQRENL